MKQKVLRFPVIQATRENKLDPLMLTYLDLVNTIKNSNTSVEVAKSLCDRYSGVFSVSKIYNRWDIHVILDKVDYRFSIKI